MPDLSTERLQGLLETSTPDPWTVAADCQTGRDYWHVDVPIERHQNVSEGILATIQRFGSHAAQADANADLMGMARDLAREVLRLRVERDEAMEILAAGREYLARDGGADLERPPELPTGLVERARHVVEALDAETQGHDVARTDLTVLAFGVRDALARGTTPAVRIARKDLADAVLAVVAERDAAQDLLLRMDALLATGMSMADLDAWSRDSRPHITAAVARRESPERGEEG